MKKFFLFRLLPELLGCFKEIWSHIQIIFHIALRLFGLSCDPALHHVFIKIKQSFHQFSNLFQQVSCKTSKLQYNKVMIKILSKQKSVFEMNNIFFCNQFSLLYWLLQILAFFQIE